MSPKIDQRKHPRLSPLIIRTEFRSVCSRGKGYLTNLSVGGAFLATDEPLPVGEVVNLTISLPWNLGDVMATAKVVWLSAEADQQDRQAPSGAGLAFSQLPPQTATQIRSYMEKFAEIAALIDEA